MSKYKQTLKKLIMDLQGTETSIDTVGLILNDGLNNHSLNEFSSVKETKAYLNGYKTAVKTLKGELNDTVWEQGDDKEENDK